MWQIGVLEAIHMFGPKWGNFGKVACGIKDGVRRGFDAKSHISSAFLVSSRKCFSNRIYSI